MRSASLIPILGLLLSATAASQVAWKAPRGELAGIEVVEKLGQRVPLRSTFRNERGDVVELGRYFDGTRPVVLTLNYAACPLLCGQQLNGLVDVLQELGMTPGKEFEIVTISIDPKEKPAQAAEKKRTFVDRLGKSEAAAGWHFLTGGEATIRSVADAVGFRYALRDNGEFVHPAVFMVLSPEGMVSRYLYGVSFPSQTMRLSLVDASEGRVGSTTDRFLLWCMDFDPEDQSYAASAFKIVRLGSVLVVVALGAFLTYYWMRERRNRLANDGAAA